MSQQLRLVNIELTTGIFITSDADSSQGSSGSSQSSQTCSVGRQQLKQCTALLNEIMKRDDAEYFLDPVDPKEVTYILIWLHNIF